MNLINIFTMTIIIAGGLPTKKSFNKIHNNSKYNELFTKSLYILAGLANVLFDCFIDPISA